MIYDEKDAMLSKNVVLSGEFFYNIRQIFDEIEPNISKFLDLRNHIQIFLKIFQTKIPILILDINLSQFVL